MLGARPLRRTVQREIEDTLAEKMLYGEVRPGQIVLVDVEGEGAEAMFTFKGEQKSELPDLPADRGAGRAPARPSRAAERSPLATPRAATPDVPRGRAPSAGVPGRAAGRTAQCAPCRLSTSDAADDHQQRERP